ncbi:MAG: hypothetical protein B7Z55_01765 [Planctomycetales bacterium 12-60-4]|nr:MAG: hypothetical protein B7Z55_01765 [Planctomycetales bacterium 12-60-4]
MTQARNLWREHSSLREGLRVSPPSHQSGRFDASGARSSSPRLAAQYNLEHDPLQSDRPHDESRSVSFLRELASGGFASSRFSAGALLVVVLVVMAICAYQATMSIVNEVGELKRRDPAAHTMEAPPKIMHIDQTQGEKSGSKTETTKPVKKKKPKASEE